MSWNMTAYTRQYNNNLNALEHTFNYETILAEVVLFFKTVCLKLNTTVPFLFISFIFKSRSLL